MAWVYLIIAGLAEIVWAYFMKASQGFTKPLESVVTIGAMVFSFWLLSLAMRTLPLGTAYPMWTGIGAIGTFIVGIAALGESASALRIAAAILIVAGLILMQIASEA